MNAEVTFPMTKTDRTESPNIELSRPRIWVGRAISLLAVLFLLLDGVMKLFKPALVVQSTVQLGYPESAIVGTGVVLLVCTLLYVIPRTAIVGAILLSAYLGGAVAINIRAATPLFNDVFPVLFGVLIWAALVLRRRDLELLLFTSK